MFLLILALDRSTFLSSILNLNNAKNLKKLNKELMSVAWHRNRRWDWFVSENEKMETDPMFIKEL